MSEAVEEQLRTMTVKELAKATGFQVWRIHQMVNEGKSPPFFRVGRTIRFRAKDVARWMDSQTQNTEVGK